MGNLKTSIIIITFNGNERLPRLLLSINEIKNLCFEVIVVDDGSHVNPNEIIVNLPLNYSWRLINQVNSGRAVAKNVGAAHAQYEFLWFLDDDMKINEDSLFHFIDHFQKLERSVCVGTTFEEGSEFDTDIQKFRCYLSEIWQRALEKLENPLSAQDLFLASANFAIKKDMFVEIGGFNSTLKDAEDLDLAYRLHLANIPIYYNLKAVGYHKDKITCRSYVIRNRQYIHGYKVLRETHPNYLNINKRLELVEVSPSRKFVLSIISQPVFVYLIDHFNVFLVLPKSIRFRFYEMLILGLGRVFKDRVLIKD